MFGRLLTRLRHRGAPAFELPPEEQCEVLPKGLAIKVLRKGAGPVPGPADRVTVRYAGWLESGRLFDASWPREVSFTLDRVIAGWREGLGCLPEGTDAILVIPPELGYGALGAPPLIAPGSTLVFRVELVRVG